jgi:hypothetical protein
VSPDGFARVSQHAERVAAGAAVLQSGPLRRTIGEQGASPVPSKCPNQVRFVVERRGGSFRRRAINQGISMHMPLLTLRSVTAAMALAFSTGAFAEPAKVLPDLGIVQSGNAAPAYSLRIAYPDGRTIERDLLAGESLGIDPISPGGQLAEGVYTYEARPILGLERRNSQDDAQAPKVTPVAIESGVFRVHQGAILVPATEKALVGGDDSDYGVRMKDQVINDDLIVTSSICVGTDCANGENFGFDTLRLKENNLRIHFEDTSNSGTFPNNDWTLIANDSANGGANYFAIEDRTAGRRVFEVRSGAPANSLFVDSSGRVGIKTGTPVLNLHIAEGNTPAMRLEQTSSSGFTAQTWDVAGNEANFFVRDVTNGSRIPFKIIPGAPSNSLYVASDGDIGLGTTSPGAPLHVLRSSGDSAALIEETNGTNAVRTMLTLQNNGGARFRFEDTSNDDHDWLMVANTLGFAISEDLSGVQEFMLQRGTGNLTIAGTLTQNSDQTRKTNITRVNGSDILGKVLSLPISTWAYKESSDILHLGPMAQDFHAAFGLGEKPTTIATIDTSGVALASIQALYELIQQRDVEIRELRERLESLEKSTR